MRFLIIGDLHGALPKLKCKDYDAIIAPGDFCSDKGIREAYMRLYNRYIKNVETKDIDWWDVVGKKNAKKMIQHSLLKGREVLQFLNSQNKPIFLVPGNWDWTSSSAQDWEFLNKNFWDKYLIKGLKNIRDVDERSVKFNDIIFLGYGRCNGPELLKFRGYGGISKIRHKRNRKKYKSLVKRFDRIFTSAKKKKLPIIFINHDVPYGKLDTIINKNSPLNGKHYGSNLARKMIDKYQPLLSIGGHMHEHFGKAKIGKTVVINAGFGANVNTIIDLDNGKIKRIKFLK